MNALSVLAEVFLVLVVLWLALRAARTALQPALDVRDFAGVAEEHKSALARVVQSEIERLGREGAGTSLRFAYGTDEALEIPQSVKLPGPVAALVSAVQLLPRNVYRLEALAISEAARGAGLALTLARSSRVVATTVVWADEYRLQPEVSRSSHSPPPSGSKSPPKSDEAATNTEAAGGEGAKPERPQRTESNGQAADGSQVWYRLALIAAAWLVYHLPTTNRRTRERGLVASDWRSYAHFLLGADYLAGQDVVRAKQAFLAAVTRDPGNVGAAVNLAGLNIDENCTGPAILRLGGVVRLLDDTAQGNRWCRDRNWYRARFNLAVACLNELMLLQQGSVPHECRSSLPPDELSTLAREALRELLTKGSEVSTNACGRHPLEFQRFVQVAVASAAVLFADVQHDAMALP